MGDQSPSLTSWSSYAAESTCCTWSAPVIEDRRLAKNTRKAVALLGDFQGRAERSVCAEVLHRALYFHRWVTDHAHIAGAWSLEDLLSRADALIQDMSLDDLTIERLGTSK